MVKTEIIKDKKLGKSASFFFFFFFFCKICGTFWDTSLNIFFPVDKNISMNT